MAANLGALRVALRDALTPSGILGDGAVASDIDVLASSFQRKTIETQTMLDLSKVSY
jgi:hypothetical protein